MLAFGYIYIMILCMSVITALIYKKFSKQESIFIYSAEFGAIYYFVICLFRTIVGNGSQYLGTSFADKTIRAYIKVGVLGVVLFLAILVFLGLTKEKGQEYIKLSVGIFAALSVLYTILIDLPRMKVTVILGFVSLLMGAILFWVLKDEKFSKVPEKSEYKKRYIELGVQLLFFCSLFLLTGPLELFAYNTNDFVFNLMEFLPYMLIYTAMLLLFSVIILSAFLPQQIFSITKICIFLYCICSYVQQMFLNGNMSKMEGNEQHWNRSEISGNLAVWLIMVILVLIMLYKSKKSNVIILYVSAFIAGIQLITFLVVLLTSNVIGTEKLQLIEDDTFKLSQNENLVIFILDAYDTQMLDMVLENDPQYLEPLHDFTYYKNMKSRYTATDGSLPYLLTGRVVEEEDRYLDIYDKSTFLKDIKRYGYDINILSMNYYVEPFEQGIIDNITEDYYCILDFEKTVSQMSRCVRYRSAPFIIKPYYYYENYDLTNVIYDTNVYLFGTDADFYSDLCKNGIYVDSNTNHAMQIYHLYGAHSPYYLTEDATLDYNSKPMAQWKGCLKIVYDYMEQLKENGLYDTTSVIVMADHGLNRSQRSAMAERNISVTDESNPIFIVKRVNQKQEQLEISDVNVSHDDFFATVIKLIDEENSDYGNAVWELTETNFSW